jgi:CelD/BcsL family acetyltransferase involved in cellulose biosynthesis
MNTASPCAGTATHARHAPEPRIEVLPDIDALRAHQAPWFALWRNVVDATPFQSPAWLLCWAEHYARGRSGAVVVKGGDQLLALLPYFFWHDTLWLAGTGTSDYGDALLAPRAANLVDALLDTLAAIARDNGCGHIDLRQLRPRSPLLAAATPHGWRDEVTPGEPCMSMPLHGEAGLGAVSKRWLRNAAYARRKLASAGSWVLQRVPSDESSHAADVLLCLHERRWSARGEAHGVFADRSLRDFVHDVIPRLGSAGLLRMHTLKLDHRPLAATFAMHAPGATCVYLTGFDPTASRCSPGLLSMVAAISAAAAEGDHTVHLLRGRERYKYHLGATECATWRRLLRRGARH